MSLASPPWLLAAVAAAIALLLFWRRADRSRRLALERFAAPNLLGELTASVSLRRRSLKRSLLVAGVLLAGLALAGPQYGFTWEETQRRGIDVLIALDTSRSMLAQDVAPNRLERAKLAVRDLVDKLGSDRVGLIAFAGSAFLQCPLTLDHAAFLESLDALQPGIIPAPGSDLASALRTAEQALATEQRNVKLLVLFSDGEDLGGGAIEAAKHAAEQGIRVFTVGVGSDTGELIPVPSTAGGTEFLKDPQGQYVKSKLDAETLRRVAELTGGFYEPLGRRGEAVAAIYDRALAPLPKEELASRMRRVPIERFQWPLGLALLCLALEPVIRERVTRGRGAGRGGTLLLALALLAPTSVRAASVREAQRLYADGKYDQALAEYRAAIGDKSTPQLDFNMGAAAYKAGQYGDAATAFARALGSDDPRLQEQGFYNLGNAQFRVGEKTRESQPQQTMQAWQQAIDAYESALKVDPQDADARYNRDFVKHALEELQKQQQQKQDQKNDQQKQDQKKDEQQQQKQQQDQQQKQDGEQKKDDQQGEQKQDQQGQDQQDQKDPQKQQPQGGEPQPTPSAQPGSQGEQKPEQQQEPPKDQQQGDAGKPSDQQDGDGQQASPPQQQPGQMSPDEARDLLDSLKDGEENLQQLDQSAQKQRRGRAREQERDW
ncbi:VWA domain-containing protein [Candidatus Binatia bacterium]|nr:VWA domain-containing protein [Candidatus Binatia bacterium]